MTSSAARSEPIAACTSISMTSTTNAPITRIVRLADCCASNWPPTASEQPAAVTTGSAAACTAAATWPRL